MLFSEIVYGPIHSRRLGVSLGMNLMPTDGKLCSFNCIYCECGFNHPFPHPVLPTREAVREALEAKLQQLRAEAVTPDVITFSGNGEPTMHPDFEGIIADTCALRDRFCPNAKVSVLSNSTQLGRPDVVRALMQCDNRILKLGLRDRYYSTIASTFNSELELRLEISQFAIGVYGGYRAVRYNELNVEGNNLETAFGKYDTDNVGDTWFVGLRLTWIFLSDWQEKQNNKL